MALKIVVSEKGTASKNNAHTRRAHTHTPYTRAHAHLNTQSTPTRPKTPHEVLSNSPRLASRLWRILPKERNVSQRLKGLVGSFWGNPPPGVCPGLPWRETNPGLKSTRGQEMEPAEQSARNRIHQRATCIPSSIPRLPLAQEAASRPETSASICVGGDVLGQQLINSRETPVDSQKQGFLY